MKTVAFCHLKQLQLEKKKRYLYALQEKFEREYGGGWSNT